MELIMYSDSFPFSFLLLFILCGSVLSVILSSEGDGVEWFYVLFLFPSSSFSLYFVVCVRLGVKVWSVMQLCIIFIHSSLFTAFCCSLSIFPSLFRDIRGLWFCFVLPLRPAFFVFIALRCLCLARLLPTPCPPLARLLPTSCPSRPSLAHISVVSCPPLAHVLTISCQSLAHLLPVPCPYLAPPSRLGVKVSHQVCCCLSFSFTPFIIHVCVGVPSPSSLFLSDLQEGLRMLWFASECLSVKN